MIQSAIAGEVVGTKQGIKLQITLRYCMQQLGNVKFQIFKLKHCERTGRKDCTSISSPPASENTHIVTKNVNYTRTRQQVKEEEKRRELKKEEKKPQNLFFFQKQTGKIELTN